MILEAVLVINVVGSKVYCVNWVLYNITLASVEYGVHGLDVTNYIRSKYYTPTLVNIYGLGNLTISA